MIDIKAEEVLPLARAAKLPCFRHRRGGKPIAVQTLWRWSINGLRGIVLETILIGGTRVTSVEALQRFFEALTAEADGRQQPDLPSVKQTASRRKQIKTAELRLRRAGI